MTRATNEIIIERWKEATQQLAEAFVEECFEEPDYWWVDEEVGGMFYVNNYFFGLDRMIEALELNATYDQLIDYYEYQTEHGMSEDGNKPTPVNFKNYVKYGAAGEPLKKNNLK